MEKGNNHSQIYPWAVTLLAVGLLIVLGAFGQLYWSYTLTFVAVACIFSEWLVLKLPEGDNLTISIIFILLALVFSFEPTSAQARAVGALEVIVVGSLIGYGLGRRPPLVQLALYVSHYVLAACLAGAAFLLVSTNVKPWLISSFHLPAVLAYTVVFSLTSMLLITPFNKRILKGNKLPKADLLYTVFLAPIALIVYYFVESRNLSLSSVLILALPLIGVLITFRLYINIDTNYGEVNQLYKISQEFVAAMSQEETVHKISDSITQAIAQLVLQLDACLIYAHNQESNEYLAIGKPQDQYGPLAIIPGHGLLGRTVFESTGTIVNDITLEDALSPEERQWPPKTAILAYPLFAEHRQIGLLVLVRYGKRFTAEEFRLVGIVANQAGVTLHNAQIFERSLKLAERDRQLDVLNQAAFIQRSERIMSRARGANQTVALLYPDIDDFRIINNTFGHPTGDRVLAGVAHLMKDIVGDKGIVGRSGGEEFFVLLSDADEQEAMDIANQIREQIEASVFASDGEREVRATVSTGVALFPRDAGDINSLIKQADRAAYLAKRMGKNRVCLYEDRKEFIELAAKEPESPKAVPIAHAQDL